MIVIVLITVFFWPFLIFNLMVTNNVTLKFKQLFWWIVINIPISWAIYRFFVQFFHIRIVMILTGLIIVVSGLRWLCVLSKDFFTIFERLTFLDFGRISISYVVYVTELVSLAQVSAKGLECNVWGWIILTNALLAGFLPYLFRIKHQLIQKKWIQPLIYMETGIYLTVMGLIISGGDVPYFIKGIEKILHI